MPTSLACHVVNGNTGVESAKLPKESEFKEYFNRLVTKWEPNIVVAISRKGPRLLEYIFKQSVANFPLVCEKAIDFLPDDALREQRVLLFDDIVIWGSTMELVRRKLANRGANVKCAAYAVETPTFFGNGGQGVQSPYAKSLDLDYFEGLSERNMTVFCNCIVNVIRASGKPYELDYPIFEMRIAKSYDDIHEMESTLLESLSDLGNVYDVTTNVHRRNGILAFSILNPLGRLWSPWPVKSNENDISPDIVQKCRFFVNLRRNRANMVPMTLIRWRKGPTIPECGIPSANAMIHELFKAVRPTKSTNLDQDIFSSEVALAEFRALNFVNNLYYGKVLLNEFNQSSGFNEIFDCSSISLDHADLEYIFGLDLAKRIISHQSSIKSPEGHKQWLIKTPTGSSATSVVNDQDLYRKVLDFNQQGQEEAGFSLKLDKKFNLEENMNRLCRSVAYVVDKQYRRDSDSLVALLRLRRGLSYSDVLHILKNEGVRVDNESLSHAIDIFNDSGMLVPINMTTSGQTLIRGCRNGENDKSYLYLRLFLREALSWQKEQNIQLTKSAFHKIFVVMSELFPDDLPNLGSVQEKMGPIAAFIPDLKPEERQSLTDYLSRHRVISIRPGKEKTKPKGSKREAHEEPRLL